MADAAQVVEAMGADIVDVNMGCPVPKIAKHNAGCSLMREPEHAASVIRAHDAGAVRIPVTVKMRAGWNEHEINAPDTRSNGSRTLVPPRWRSMARTAAQSERRESDWGSDRPTLPRQLQHSRVRGRVTASKPARS